MFLLETELEAVVSDMRARWQPRLGRLRKLVRNVREISRVWPHTGRDFQGLPNTQMGRVRFVAQCIDDQDLYARDKMDNSVRNTAAIAQIRDEFLAAARKEISVYDRITMWHG